MAKIQMKRSKKGSTLVLAAGLVVFLAVMGVALLQLGLRARILAARTAAEITARAAADAGLAQAIYLMNDKLKETRSAGEEWDNSWIPYLSAVTNLSNAEFSFDITGDESHGFTIVSTGQAGIAEKTVNCKIWVKSLWFGIGVRETLIAKANAQFGTIPSGGEFAIQTNSSEPGAIILNSDVVVPGDVIVGPEGNPAIGEPDSVIILKEGAVIEGETYSGPELFFPEVLPPDGLVDYGINMEAKGETKTIGDESGHYRSGVYTGLRMLETSVPGRLEIIDPNVVLYFTGDIDIGTKCELVVRKGASVTVYLGADMKTGEASMIINENITDLSTATDEELAAAAMALKIYGTDSCGSVDIRTKSNFFGAVYARRASLLLRNDGDLYGAFVGNDLEMMNSSGFFYYINALSHIDIDDETATDFEIECWWE